jgi:hypothetical protein
MQTFVLTTCIDVNYCKYLKNFFTDSSSEQILIRHFLCENEKINLKKLRYGKF